MDGGCCWCCEKPEEELLAGMNWSAKVEELRVFVVEKASPIAPLDVIYSLW